jgi:hypothetical protein
MILVNATIVIIVIIIIDHLLTPLAPIPSQHASEEGCDGAMVVQVSINQKVLREETAEHARGCTPGPRGEGSWARGGRQRILVKNAQLLYAAPGHSVCISCEGQ